MNPVTSRPVRTPDQRLEALRHANAIRSRRAFLKCEMKAGRMTATVILLDVEDALLSMKAFDLLSALPKVGRVKAARILNTCRVSQSKTVGGLSARQRSELIALLEGR